MARKETLTYPDGEGYDVQIGDKVEIEVTSENFGTNTFEGEITAISPRKAQVRVLYADALDFAKTTGEPRIKSTRARIGDVTFIARVA